MHIRPPQPGDFSDMATLAHKALFDDPFSEYVAPYRHQNPECMRQGYLRRAKRRFYGGKYMLVAVTDQQDPDWNGTERVVGYLSANSTQRQTDRARQSWFSWNSRLLPSPVPEFLLILIRPGQISNWLLFRWSHSSSTLSVQTAHCPIGITTPFNEPWQISIAPVPLPSWTSTIAGMSISWQLTRHSIDVESAPLL